MLRVVPVDAHYARLDRAFQGQLHPAEYVPVVRSGGQTADHQVWIEASHFDFEPVEVSGEYLRMRAQYLDTGRNHLPVGAVIVLQTQQYPQCDYSLAAAPPLTTGS